MRLIKTRNPKHRRIASYRRQSGVVLAVSLVLLASLTILGIATLSGTRLSESIAANAQQKLLSFQVAESSIKTVWSAQLLKEAAIAGAGTVLNEAAAEAIPESVTGLDSDYDFLTTDGKNIEVGGTVTAQYCGEIPAVNGSLDADESSPQMAAMLIDVTSNTAVANTQARTRTVRRGSVTSIATGRSSSCPAP